MKTIFLYFVVVLFSNACASSKENMQKIPEKYPTIGMSIQDFSKEYPNIVKENNIQATKQYTSSAEIMELEGDWVYDFKNGKLNYYLFHSYSDEINKKKFQDYLSATQNQIKELSQTFQEPKEVTEGQILFIDPSVERHWGYDVISAIWEYENMKISLEFRFIGGKGEYLFLFKMHFDVL